jgi:hypothetical protein
MAFSSGPVDSTLSVQGSGIDTMMRNIAREIENQEKKFRATFVEGLRPDGDLMGFPKHIQDQFKKWDETFTSPEDRKLVAELKNKIIEITTNTQDYIGERVRENSNKFRLEIAMKAVGKTTSGIQQLLSAQ